MAEDARPPIFGTAVEGWRYTFAAMSRMPLVLGVGLLGVIAVSVAIMPFDSMVDKSLVGRLIEFAISIVNGFILTPVAIAIHRFVLLGEITDRYRINPFEPRFLQFFIWTVLFQFSTAGAGLMLALSGPDANSIFYTWGAMWLIFGAIASLRLLILFPAIAVEAPGALWQNANDDTKGHTWRVLGILTATAIPLFVIIIVIAVLITWLWPEETSFGYRLALVLLTSFAITLALCVYAAVASRLFAAFSKRLNVKVSQPERVSSRS